MQFQNSNWSIKNIVAFLKRFLYTTFSKMPLFSVNMAVPVKETVRESQIYFLSSAETVPQENFSIDKKYLIFKIFELIISLCGLLLYAYGMRATENEIGDMLKYITLGVVTIYPLLFILLMMNINQRPIFSVLCNTLSMVALFVIGGTTVSTSLYNTNYLKENNEEKYFAKLMRLRSSCLLFISGILYFVESIVMCIQAGKFYFTNDLASD